MMLWTVYYTVTKSDDTLVYDVKPKPTSQSIGSFYGGNPEDLIEKVCFKIGHPLRFDKDIYESGSYEYEYIVKDPSTLVTICHRIQVAPIEGLIKLC